MLVTDQAEAICPALQDFPSDPTPLGGGNGQPIRMSEALSIQVT